MISLIMNAQLGSMWKYQIELWISIMKSIPGYQMKTWAAPHVVIRSPCDGASLLIQDFISALSPALAEHLDSIAEFLLGVLLP